MKYLHTMLRVRDIDASLRFYCEGLGLKETRRMENAAGKFTLMFLAADETPGAEIELTYNWGSDEDYGTARNFGHLAFRVDDIYKTCAHLQAMGYAISRPRATATWLSCARPIWSRLNCCRRAVCRRRSRGHPCPISAFGDSDWGFCYFRHQLFKPINMPAIPLPALRCPDLNDL